MQSLKSTVVAVLLLGLSIGLYQISDTKDVVIEDSLVPALEISESGAQLVASSSADPVKPHAPVLPITQPVVAPPQLQPFTKPATLPPLQTKPENPSVTPANPTATLPVLVPKDTNTQSFDYASMSKSAAGASTVGTNMGTSSGAPDDFRQRVVVSADRDQQLIAALQNESSVKSGNDFSVPKVTPSNFAATEKAINTEVVEPAIGSRYQFASTNAASGTAQPIGASDSSVTQLAGNRIPELNNGSDISLATSEPDLDSIPLSAAWPEVDRLVAESRYRDALKLLSRFYRADEAAGPQRQRLLGWLDALAGKVIFSAEHHYREQPYTVGPNESLVDIASRWQVPAQLVFNINRNEIPNPLSLAPGTLLKVVDRPFDANIDLKSNIMTLFTDGLYAGRYPVRIGVSGNAAPGTYRVLAKAAGGFDWRDATGKVYSPDEPENGYGPHWIGLSGSLCMHALKKDAKDGHHGCIGFNPTDAADIFQILSKASTVTIID